MSHPVQTTMAYMKKAQKLDMARKFMIGALIVVQLAIFGCGSVGISTPTPAPHLETEKGARFDTLEIEVDESETPPSPTPSTEVSTAPTGVAASALATPHDLSSNQKRAEPDEPASGASSPGASVNVRTSVSTVVPRLRGEVEPTDVEAPETASHPTATPTPQPTATPTQQPTSTRTAVAVNQPQQSSVSTMPAPHEPVYLEQEIPPCNLPTDVDVDPCGFEPDLFYERIPSWDGTGIVYFGSALGRHTDALGQGQGHPEATEVSYIFLPAHKALRGTWLPGTARCKDDFSVSHDHFELNRTLENSRPIEKPTWFPGSEAIHCYMDAAVQEYIVGDGPPRLTLEIYYRSAVLGAHETYEAHRDHVLPQLESALRGREMVLYIKPPWSVATEVFALEGAWDVQRNEGGYYVNYTSSWSEERKQRLQHLLDGLVCQEELCVVGQYPFFEIMGLRAFEQSTREAHRRMLESHEGRIYPGEAYARIVQDANKLTEFLAEVGAYDVEGFNPVPPPPISSEQQLNQQSKTGDNCS